MSKEHKKGKFALDALPSITMVPLPNLKSLLSAKRQKRPETTKTEKTRRKPLNFHPTSRNWSISVRNSVCGIRITLSCSASDFPARHLIPMAVRHPFPLVMKTARQLLAENGESSRKLREKFEKPMSEIITEWETRLGTTTDAEIAGLIGVVTMTISRWRKNETKPDLAALNRYDRIVNLIASNIRQHTGHIKMEFP